MRYFYIKKGKQYLHIKPNVYEDYQDYSDISAMVTQHYVFLDTKDDAIKFLEKREVDYFLVTRGRKLKGVEVVSE